MGKLVIDITELANWQGKLTGVPRVMDELSSRFAGDGKCVFVTWDGPSKSYREVDFVPDGGQGKKTSQPAAITDSRGQKLSGAINLAKKVKRRSRVATKVLILPEKAARKLLATQPLPESGRAVYPQKGDLVFVLADWHGSDQAFVDYLISLKRAGVGLAQMSYDLLPIVTPQYSGHATDSLTNYTKSVYPLCDIIFAISEHTRKDIIAWLRQNRLDVPQVEVMRLGDGFRLAKPIEPADSKFVKSRQDNGDFVLCVGTVEARKNHALLYYVYKLARQKNIDLPNIVIVGRRGWKSDDIYEIITTDPQTKDQFVFLEGAADEELAWLYDNALFSVYPSFYEGWGLPIAESIAHGLPCVCSNTSSMPEIAGDLVDYFSPYSTDECLEAMTNMLKSGAINAAKRKIEAYRPVAWDQSASFVKKFIEEIYARNS